MRKFVAGNGSDVTAAVQAHLSAHRQLEFADLYVITTAKQYAGHEMGRTFLLTDWPTPLKWSFKGTFATANIQRGEVESKIGLESQSLDVTWSPRAADVVAADGSGNTLLSALEGFSWGIFDQGEVEVWRCLMPTPGDADTFGACCLFGGRIGNIDPAGLAAKFAVISRMEAFTTHVPTIQFEPDNITGWNLPGRVPDGAPGSLTVAAGSTASLILATGGTPAAGVYDGGYIQFTAGKLGGHSVNLAGAGPSAGDSSKWAFALERPLPFAPTAGDTFTGYIDAVRVPAWPYIPEPVNTAMISG